MKNLIKAEWYKFSHRKIMLLSFLSVPFLIGLSYIYLNQENIDLLKSSIGMKASNFSTNITFPYLVVQEQLILIFSILTIFYVATIITEEFKNGAIRITLTKGYTLTQVIFSKIILITIVISLLFLGCFILSTIVGNIFMPKANCAYTFFRKEKMGIVSTIMYGVKFYILSYLITLAMASLMIFIGVISKSRGIMVGIGLVIIITGMLTMKIIDFLMLNGFISSKSLIPFFVITELQFRGAAIILEGSTHIKNILLLVIFLYIIIFTVLSLVYGKIKDYLD
ncbi:hypothetical protein FDF74_04860 [Clostridium niameyense]|uniref:ABC transporter permease n=1 Tax=Clostridium niameyense TaxID=1622073 RepID=A0A6M0R8H9_9CLOT|nr:ABC transporter permease [Clostridium niameyense]NEZ46545.1 hypothetical protein [Clostridium niameyense]